MLKVSDDQLSFLKVLLDAYRPDLFVAGSFLSGREFNDIDVFVTDTSLFLKLKQMFPDRVDKGIFIFSILHDLEELDIAPIQFILKPNMTMVDVVSEFDFIQSMYAYNGVENIVPKFNEQEEILQVNPKTTKLVRTRRLKKYKEKGYKIPFILYIRAFLDLIASKWFNKTDSLRDSFKQCFDSGLRGYQ